jgi:2-polyprenyl-6-methoxyphenol hydroxylase-like FAD-dependent oxidoreductase
MVDADVLVAGAGPTGLTTALQAHDHGATVRIVERRPQAFRPSRAMIVHPRTLESLRPLGVTDALLERGDRAPGAELHLGRHHVRVQLADVALPDSPFPHLTLLRQAEMEEVLAEALRQRGVRVERDVELVHAWTDGGVARAALATGGRLQHTSCHFLAGCDGPGSKVRTAADIGWVGGPYREEVVLADLELDGALEPGLLHIAAARAGLVFLFALGEGATWRFLATRRQHDAAPGDAGMPYGQPGPDVPSSQIQDILTAAGLPVTIGALRWSAQVRLQHRLATTFRRDHLFLAGDAAHAHSPAAAQGMNSGILDGVNLGWKLAFAAHAAEPEELLDSYSLERRPVARQVLALTHLAFFAEASTNPLPTFLRGTVAPLAAPVLPHLLTRPGLMAQVVRLLSQRWVRYRHSALSVEGLPPRGGPRAGDRLPDALVLSGGQTRHLHELTARAGIHVLLQRDSRLPQDAPRLARVSVHRIDSWPGTGVIAVRPDGHVGFRCGASDPAQLGAWLDLVGAP